MLSFCVAFTLATASTLTRLLRHCRIGFEDKDGAVRCAVASLLLLSGFTAAKIAAIDNSALHTFASPVSVLGSNVLFLALMIIASKYTYPARHNRRALSYVGRNILMVGALLLAWGFGFVWGMPGMSTTATVYAVLFGMEKYVYCPLTSFVEPIRADL